MRRQALKVLRAIPSASVLLLLTHIQIPVTQDVCIFCLAHIQFASDHALRRPQRRLLSSTRALRRPPATGVAQKEDDGAQGSDPAWGSQPSRPFGGSWARTTRAEPSDLAPEEIALRNALQKDYTREPVLDRSTSPQQGRNRTTQGPRISMHPRKFKLDGQLRLTRQNGQKSAVQEQRSRSSPSETHVPHKEMSYKRVHLNLQDGRLNDPTPTEASQIASIVGNPEENSSAPMVQFKSFTETLPPSESQIPQRLRSNNWAARTPTEAPQFRPVIKNPEYSGPRRIQSRTLTEPLSPSKSQIPQNLRSVGWAKSEVTAELTSDEKALRQDLLKEATPKADLPEHRTSHSPHIASVQGYQSRPDWQKEDARSEGIARISPVQRSSTKEQRTQESTDDPRLSEHHQVRDAQLDHHIPQSRKAPEDPTWWRHVKRIGSNVSLELSQPGIVSAQGRLGDTQAVARDIEATARDIQAIARDNDAIARARVVEQEKTERMKRTKSGGFVGLRSQYETATPNAMEASYWSLEANGSHVSHVEKTHSTTPDKPISGSGLVDPQAQSAENPQVKETLELMDKESGQKAPDESSEDRPRVARHTGGWKRWESSSAREQPLFGEPSRRGPSNQIDGSTHPSSAELEREQKASELDSHVKKRQGLKRLAPQEPGIAKQLLYDGSIHHTKDNDRNRIRKSKKVVSAYDDMDEEDEDRAARRMERKEQKKRAKASKKTVAPPTPLYLPEFISVSNLAGVLRVRIEDFMRKMEDLGFEETNNDLVLDAETAGLVAAEFNFEAIFEQAENPDLLPRPPAEDKSVLPPRPPVVTIMGHVDHGKTTLLDYLRKSSVAASEHGGITQHIGAFSVPMPGGRLVTFLDTPGHEAFLSMRQRGANVTDIVILVVAADDSVKPQTVEAVKHAQTAKVPMIVAINKIDKDDSNAERVKRDLARYGVEVEDYGGDTQAVCVSGKTGQGMEELEDAAVALADILDMRSETDGQAEGWILEATTRKSGRVATVLVKRGTLRPGDIIVAGTSWARVRSLRNEAGVMLKSAGPGTPVEIDGWRKQPAAGDEVLQAPDEQKAKAVVDYRLEAYERTRLATDMAAVNEARRLEQEKREELERAAEQASDATAAATSAEGQSTAPTQSFQEVFFIVKADVSGSVEAVTNAVSALGNSEVRPHILRTGVGHVNESDIDHAAVAKGHIISFNTTVDGNIQRTAEANEVMILNQSIIYRLVDDVKAKLSEKLPDIVTQKVVGEAEIAQVFEINTKGRIRVPVAGCRIKNGVVARNNKVRVLRGKETIYDGMLFHDACAHCVRTDKKL